MMQKFTLLLIASFLFFTGHAQKEKLIFKTVAAKFDSFYNRGNYDSIFYLFATDLKKSLPLPNTIKLLSDTKSQAGKVISRSFEGYEATYALYKAAFERRTMAVYMSLDNRNLINGLYIKTYEPNNLPQLQRNSTKLIVPFTGIWTVLWGGDTKENNYHVEVPVQKGAFDFIVTDTAGKAYRSDSKANEDYYAFGKDIIAACAGEILLSVDGIKDNLPGTMNPMFVTGNTVILKTPNNEYLVYAHFKKNSIVVKEGDIVKQGALLGKCGNSGNSSEPHLHFHIQNVEDLTIATGAKCFFDSILVNGKLKTDHSPIKNERIQNKGE